MTQDSENNFYIAFILSRSTRDNSEPGLWEECVAVVEASSEDEATRVAAAFGRERQTSFTSIDGTLIAWEFHSVTQVSMLEIPLKNGYEISSRHLRNDEAVSLLRPIDDD
ncbi:DUF4288 domain-containing protein [Pseudoxanthomonas indica]|uniref:DUF4288 domain-containing protein n=1 Tax=Pseudoxanthomonas indica TaxID=428993 RepID=UPI0009A79D9A|nr:DUF4288 domain-containing protein [Pseudoxanthomonas indica]GGD36191.1 hypothetical protein GCM10007235_05210 [Pseudoxanthomonas indica]